MEEDKQYFKEQKRSLNNRLFVVESELINISSDLRRLEKEEEEMHVLGRQLAKKLKRLKIEQERLDVQVTEIEEKKRTKEEDKMYDKKKLEKLRAEQKVLEEKEIEYEKKEKNDRGGYL